MAALPVPEAGSILSPLWVISALVSGSFRMLLCHIAHSESAWMPSRCRCIVSAVAAGSSERVGLDPRLTLCVMISSRHNIGRTVYGSTSSDNYYEIPSTKPDPSIESVAD